MSLLNNQTSKNKLMDLVFDRLMNSDPLIRNIKQVDNKTFKVLIENKIHHIKFT